MHVIRNVQTCFNNQLNAQFLYSITTYMLHYNPLHVSSRTMPIFRRSYCFITASGIVTLCKRPYSTQVKSWMQSALNRRTIQPFTEKDDTRCCNNTIWPPEDGHSTARNMSRIIMYHIYCCRIKEMCIKLVIETILYYEARSEKHQFRTVHFS